jgi:hypothetical protein
MIHRIAIHVSNQPARPGWIRFFLSLIAVLGCLQLTDTAYAYSVNLSPGNCNVINVEGTLYYHCHGSGSVAVGTGATLDKVKWFDDSSGDYLGIQERQTMQDLGGGSYNYAACGDGQVKADNSGPYTVRVYAYIEGEMDPVANNTGTWSP